jgi:DNA-binding CsgD family transcriptional regulator
MPPPKQYNPVMVVKGAAWPLVGRDEELAAIQAVMEDSGVSGVVVAGAAGVGKTRLAGEVLDRARARGFAAQWAVATRAASAITFGALAQLLPDLGVRGADQVQLLRWAAAALQEEAGGRRLVLGIDDAHLLDRGSAALVHQLAATSAAFVVLTIRSREPVPDAILGLWKDGLAERLELRPLSRREVEHLLCAILVGPVDALTLHRLSTATQGNSLLLRELVLAGLELGKQRNGVWHWSGPLGVTHRLADLIEARLGRLDGRQRAILELLAIGEPLSPSVLGQMIAPGVLEALERQSLVVVEPQGRRLDVRFAHPLYREVLRRHTPILRARTVCRQLADTLEDLGMRRRQDLLRVAVWRLDAGAPVPADLLTAAARQAARADDVLAERLARAAVEAGGGLEAGIALGRALDAQRRFGEAEQVLRGLAELASSDQQRADLAVLRSDNLRLLHRYREAIAELQAAYEAVTERRLRDRLAPALARSLVHDGRVREALELASAVLADEPTDQAAFAQAIWITAGALVLTGRANDAIAVTELRGRLGDRWEVETAWSNEMIESVRVAACLSLGRCDDAEAIADASYRRSLGNQWAWGVTFWAFELMTVALARGRVRTAVRWGQDRIAQVPSMGDATLFHLQLVRPLAMAGDLSGAVASLGKADAERTTRSRLALLGVEEARRWIEAGQGSLSTAVRLALRAADLAESMGVNDSYAVALHDAARLGGAAQVADRLRSLAAVVDGPVVPLYAAHATALTTADAAALEEVAASFEAIGAMLLAAEAAAEAAIAHRAAGRKEAARASAARASVLARSCEGARTPALRLLSQPPELTQREREIAGLAAAGDSNRAIAGQLMLSVRTVDNHLQHVFDKLGVHSRRELARLLEMADRADRRAE